ncbi:protein ecsB [Lentilactobacillus fungorum]|uniref:Protein ecsB n=1 Tax=Lentilactobacillus fungorum TaxID=2201250 RepID=A0ABQ3VVM3_9LACO|nr:ABC transporter permease [Lentilactobacillus fungorum]GHP12933.1 protein ecsB [Lentilactobacillus fungorum]
MKQLFKRRLVNHLKEMMSYLRLVFNDYFVLALLFMIGGLGYYYSNALKQLHVGVWWAPLVSIGIHLVGLQLGRMATLVQDPDYVFLLPKEFEMIDYLKRGFNYSLILAWFIQILIWFVMLPFIQITTRIDSLEMVMLLLILLGLKATWLNAEFARKYRLRPNWRLGYQRLIWRFIIPLLALTIAAYFSYVAALLLVAAAVVASWVGRRSWSNRSVDWQTMINDENSRMHTVYQFFNLFTDVPAISGSVKRRRYLDTLLGRIKLIPDNTYLYLYAHGIARDNEMSGLYVRLMVIGTLLLVFIKGEALPIVLCLLFVYLIGFQMIPFYFHFDDNAFVHIYPVTHQFQLKNFQRVLLWLLSIVAIIFGIAVIAVNANNLMTILGVIIGEAVEIWAFIYLYVPRRIARGQRSRD